MKLGLSSYSLVREMKEGRMSILDVVQWAADEGCEHIEIVPAGFDIHESGMPEKIRDKASSAGLSISNYAVNANFDPFDSEAFEEEIARMKRQVDIARRLGSAHMRHDVAWRRDADMRTLAGEVEGLAEACRRIADYAAEFGIATSMENHGFYLQGSDRIQYLIGKVGRERFGLTMDIGNFLCGDEDPVIAVKRNVHLATMIHLKDFYVRPANADPGEGFFQSAGGRYLRGAIFGHGDIDVREVLRCLKAKDYTGYVSLEFEGMEDSIRGSRIGLANARAFLQEG
ncbi:sugar phosphate isomerase/epimerase [Paenibacillus sp. HB172176]|uniref:sugar phosphate isomerase/epimerase family protein n=1 Tax=Paenibacillus sp. HB172176 TaxID=2493690 RepID=UPI00143B9593|nr:sugar phosphate isomerase/epimerase [Paenibacillus sp. HB172176]